MKENKELYSLTIEPHGEDHDTLGFKTQGYGPTATGLILNTKKGLDKVMADIESPENDISAGLLADAARQYADVLKLLAILATELLRNRDFETHAVSNDYMVITLRRCKTDA